MLTIVGYELKKIFDVKALIAIICLVLYSLIMAFIWYGYDDKITLTSKGEIVSDISAYRVLKNESESIEGIISTNYLKYLVDVYDGSVEKMYYHEYLDTYINRFQSSNYIFNYAGLGGSMNSGYMDLDYEFMESEHSFENQYKETLLTYLVEKNDGNHGIAFSNQYSEQQIEVLNKKIEKLSTNFKIGYNVGWYNIIVAYGQQFIVLLIVIAFSLSSIFSKDSSNGIEEISLSTMYGRNKNMNGRLIAGNIFAVIVYLLFLVVLMLIHGSISTLAGFNTSIQIYWYVCYYNISFGFGVLVMFFWGLLAVLVVANFVMMISIKARYVIVTTILSVSSVLYLKQLTVYSNPIALQLNPFFYATRLTTSNLVQFDIPHFIGNTLIPYSVLTIIITIVYILIITLFTKQAFKKYKTH